MGTRNRLSNTIMIINPPINEPLISPISPSEIQQPKINHPKNETKHRKL